MTISLVSGALSGGSQEHLLEDNMVATTAGKKEKKIFHDDEASSFANDQKYAPPSISEE